MANVYIPIPIEQRFLNDIYRNHGDMQLYLTDKGYMLRFSGYNKTRDYMITPQQAMQIAQGYRPFVGRSQTINDFKNALNMVRSGSANYAGVYLTNNILAAKRGYVCTSGQRNAVSVLRDIAKEDFDIPTPVELGNYRGAVNLGQNYKIAAVQPDYDHANYSHFVNTHTMPYGYGPGYGPRGGIIGGVLGALSNVLHGRHGGHCHGHGGYWRTGVYAPGPMYVMSEFSDASMTLKPGEMRTGAGGIRPKPTRMPARSGSNAPVTQEQLFDFNDVVYGTAADNLYANAQQGTAQGAQQGNGQDRYPRQPRYSGEVHPLDLYSQSAYGPDVLKQSYREHGILIDDSNPQQPKLVIQSTSQEFDMHYDLTPDQLKKILPEEMDARWMQLHESVKTINTVIGVDYQDQVTVDMLKSNQQIGISMKPEKLQEIQQANAQQAQRDQAVLRGQGGGQDIQLTADEIDLMHGQGAARPGQTYTITPEERQRQWDNHFGICEDLGLSKVSDKIFCAEAKNGREVSVTNLTFNPLDNGKVEMMYQVNGQDKTVLIDDKEYQKYLASNDLQRLKIFAQLAPDVRMADKPNVGNTLYFGANDTYSFHGSDLALLDETKGWYTGIKEGKAVAVGDVAIEMRETGPVLTAFIDGKVVEKAISQKDFDKFINMDDLARMHFCADQLGDRLAIKDIAKEQQIANEKRYCASPYANGMAYMAENTNKYFRDARTKQEITVTDIAVNEQEIKGRYLMTAVINGQAYGYEINKAQYDKFQQADLSGKIKEFTKVFQNVQAKDRISVGDQLAMILFGAPPMRPAVSNPEFYGQALLASQSPVRTSVTQYTDMAMNNFDTGYAMAYNDAVSQGRGM